MSDIFDGFDKDDIHFCAYEDCEEYVSEDGDLCEFHLEETMREAQEEEENRRWQESEYRISAF